MINLPILDDNGNVVGREEISIEALAKDLKEKTLDMFECPRSSLPEEYRNNWKRDRVSLLLLHKAIEKKAEKTKKQQEQEERNNRIQRYAEQVENWVDGVGQIEYDDFNAQAFTKSKLFA